MRYIDLQTWPRREHFKIYKDFDLPHFSLCANVDLTSFYPAVKQGSYPVTTAIVYVLARVANSISEFRYRIRAGQVIEHDVVHPSLTILTRDLLPGRQRGSIIFKSIRLWKMSLVKIIYCL